MSTPPSAAGKALSAGSTNKYLTGIITPATLGFMLEGLMYVKNIVFEYCVLCCNNAKKTLHLFAF
jgi:hypothetical protein